MFIAKNKNTNNIAKGEYHNFSKTITNK